VTFIYISVAVGATPERITCAKPVDIVTGNRVCRVTRTAAGTVCAKRADRTDWGKEEIKNMLMRYDLQY